MEVVHADLLTAPLLDCRVDELFNVRVLILIYHIMYGAKMKNFEERTKKISASEIEYDNSELNTTTEMRHGMRTQTVRATSRGDELFAAFLNGSAL